MSKRFLNIPLIFLSNNNDYNYTEELYKIRNITLLLNNNNFKKNNYFMFYYVDSYLFDKNFLYNCLYNKFRVITYLEFYKKKILFIYYNNSFYNCNSLLKFIKLFSFSFNIFFYFLNFKYKNLKILYIIYYIKKKKCLL